MKEISKTKELQRIELGILREVDSFCRRNGIRYFLCGGTLLGAIRHKGFIPWDDDVDIAMFRDDYERFLAEFESTFCDVKHYKIDSRFIYPYAKVYDTRTILHENGFRNCEYGVFIDLFPFDVAGQNMRTWRKATRRWQRMRDLLVLSNVDFWRKGRSVLKQAILFITSPLRLIPNRWFLTRLINKTKSISKHPGEQGFVGCLVWGYGEREKVPLSAYGSVVPVEFEGHSFPAMSGWDAYLSSLYGDYMTPPPPDKRVSHHDFKAWWK